MRKALAIKGHETRGNEVIELLKMLGGSNKNNLSGNHICAYYVNGHQNIIKGIDYIFGYEDMKFFTLEKFLEKYPFKVGDKVRIPEYESEVRIDKMYWNGYEIQYEVYTDEVETYSAEELKEWNEFYRNDIKGKVNDNSNKQSECEKCNSGKIIEKSEMNVNDNNVDLTLKGEIYHGNRISYLIPDGYEFSKIENNEIILQKKKPTYPKTYEECCDVLNIDPIRIIEYDESWGRRSLTQYDTDILAQLKHFRKLLICRYAYWKIAGEELGLGKPWKPDFTNNDEVRYGIYTIANKVEKDFCGVGDVNTILTFPTEEMRDAFYEIFKDLIEKCKELL